MILNTDIGPTLGFGQMSEMQQEAFMDMASMALLAASHCGDQAVMDKAIETVHETVRLFGGEGLTVHEDY